MGEVTLLLGQLHAGNLAVREQLLALIYDELKRLANRQVARERRDHSLGATALINEAYLKLFANHDLPKCNDRLHFFAIAATAMRRIAVDHARRRLAARRGGAAKRLELREDLAVSAWPDQELLSLHEALLKLDACNAEAAQLVNLRFFGELSTEEIAQALGTSERTVRRRWIYARAWLRREMSTGEHAHSRQ